MQNVLQIYRLVQMKIQQKTSYKHNLFLLMILESISRTGSLTNACIENDCEPTTISRLLSGLEKELGVQLLDRKKKPAQLSHFAVNNLPLIRRIIRLTNEFYDSAEQVHKSRRKLIRFSLTTSSLTHPVLAQIEEFNILYPDIAVEVVPDRTHKAVLSGEVDVAIVPYLPGEKELAVTTIGACLNLLVASPEYLAKKGEPKIITDLKEHRHTLLLKRKEFYPEAEVLHFKDQTYDLTSGHWYEQSRDGEIRSLNKEITPGSIEKVYVGDQNGYIGAKTGAGIAVDLPLSFIEKELASGELIAVLKGWRRKPWRRNLVSLKTNSEWKELQTFIHWFRDNEAKEARRRWSSIYHRLDVPREAYSSQLLSE